MNQEEIDGLAAELRGTYCQSLLGNKSVPWEMLNEKSKDHWRTVAIEAHRWLVG